MPNTGRVLVVAPCCCADAMPFPTDLVTQAHPQGRPPIPSGLKKSRGRDLHLSHRLSCQGAGTDSPPPPTPASRRGRILGEDSRLMIQGQALSEKQKQILRFAQNDSVKEFFNELLELLIID